MISKIFGLADYWIPYVRVSDQESSRELLVDQPIERAV